ncbi:SusC/RagA family TonB-linked outer membrane protein [Odoribacter sp. AF15-53]|uniref:SusC/RagA family TonB-linked outer membrane protein n=1 Tax=Odoribacter sp. AF15-53 TaxID=2292236 RepID=UPI001F400F44|nr:SusC/RagA family TonB-linked outer membrane protein [Odoribacter sp. AF15-53]
MKLSSLFMLLFCVNLSAGVHAQEARLSVEVENCNIREIIRIIKQQSDYTFVYNVEELDHIGSITLKMKDSDVRTILEACLKNSGYTYSILDKVIVIRKIEIPQEQEIKKIRGVVTDKQKSPLPGVTVMIKGTTIGVATDKDGKFQIVSPKDTSNIVLLVSFVGMKTQTVTYKGQENLSIVLEEDSQEMDEVVVTGYQVVDRKKNTSAVSTVKMDDIMIPGATSVDQMLQGQVPDLMFMSNSGEVGVVPKLRIRGTSTLIGNREPLWVVDGIIVQDPVNISPEELNDPDYINRIGNAIAGLNPQDIERLDILKDAAATAIYGTKAANGVIVITTKKGQVGRPIVRYNMTTTLRQRPRYSDRKINLMNSKERIQFSKELFDDHYVYNDYVNLVGFEDLIFKLYNGAITPAEFDKEVARIETMNTDWFKLLTEDSWSHSHTLSVSGGSEDARYYASIGYSRDNDVIKGNKNERYTAALNMDVNMTKWLTASFNMNGNVSNRDYYPQSIAPMDYAYKTSRAIPAYDENGEYYYYKKKVTTSNFTEYNYNILNELENSSYEQEGTGLTVTANLQFKFTDWLNANAVVSYNTSNTTQEEYWGEKTWRASTLRGTEYGVALTEDDKEYSEMPFGGELQHSETRNNSYTVRLQLNANKSLGAEQQHNIFASAGYEMSSTTYKGYNNTSRGYYPDRGMSFVQNIALEDYANYRDWIAEHTPSLTDDLTNIISGYVSASYSYKGWFTLNGNARVDGSNRFGDQSNNRFNPIWSLSANWNLSEINWLKRNWIDFITLKTSFGYQGNMLNSESPVMIISKEPLDTYYNEQTATLKQNANPDLKWEKTSSYNLGLDFSLFRRKLMVEASYYLKKTKKAFMSKTIASMNGINNNTFTINRGNVNNSGYSFALTISPFDTKDFRWTLSTSFSRTINKLKNDPAADTYELNDFLDGTALVKGKAVGTFYSYKFTGLSPVDGGPMFDDMGDEYDKLLNLSKYETYTRLLEASGRREPIMSGGLNTTLRYKKLRISGSFAYSLGNKVRLFGMYGQASGSNIDLTTIYPERNMDRMVMNRWKKPGDEKHTTIPAIIGSGHPSYNKYSSHWSTTIDGIQKIAYSAWDMYDYSNHRVVSGNYLKCNNLSFTYEFGTEQISKIGMSRLELTLSGSNLFTICSKKLRGQAPTQSGFAEIQLSDRPTYSISLNVSF